MNSKVLESPHLIFAVSSSNDLQKSIKNDFSRNLDEVILSRNCDDLEKKLQTHGLVHVVHRYEIPKVLQGDKIDLINQSTVLDDKVLIKQQFFIDDQFKNIFENEMYVYHVTSEKSDQAVAR